MNATHRKILRMALPSIASNISVPLLGLADMAITGHLGAPRFIAAVALGSSAFSLLYWLWGFLRMGTSGLVVQALGAGEETEARHVFLRALAVAAVGTLSLWILQTPLSALLFTYFDGGPTVNPLAQRYFDLLIWGAPAVLGQYVLTGWFVAHQRARLPLYVALVQNSLNIPASLFFVFVLGWKVEGVALGTLLSQYAGLATALFFLGRHDDLRNWQFPFRDIFRRAALWRFFQVNRDIFLRTLFLVAVTSYFSVAGAAQGETILSANALLLQFYLVVSYFMDGFAYAGEALGGYYVGARDTFRLRATVRAVFLWAGSLAVVFSLVYILAGDVVVRLLTDLPSVRSVATTFLPYVWAIPLCSFAAFIWDGFYIGATATRGMLLSVALSSVLFFLLYFCLRSHLGNHALWLSFISYLSLRGVIQTILWQRYTESSERR